MKLIDIIEKSLIIPLEGNSKKDCLNELISVIEKKNLIKDTFLLTQKIMEREELMSTGIGMGIGIPHVKICDVANPIVAVGINKSGISDYEAIDDMAVTVVIMIICNEGEDLLHTQILAQLVKVLKNGDAIKNITDYKDINEVYEILTVEL